MRRARVALVFAVALGLAACGDGSPSMFDSQGPESRSIRGVSVLMFVLAGAVYVIVSGFIVVAIVRGRRRADGAELAKEPKDDTFIWWGGIVAPVVILAVLAVVTIRTTQDLRAAEDGELRIEVTAKRWWWDVRYPDTGVATASEIHIPVGRPVDIVLTSDNVIHSFWVPQLAGKVDTIPGQVNHLRLRADEAGTYRGMCAEYCGIQHANMSYSRHRRGAGGVRAVDGPPQRRRRPHPRIRAGGARPGGVQPRGMRRLPRGAGHARRRPPSAPT